MNAGYYRFPAIYRDQIVFVSEDDLWTVPSGGGVARRLTSGLGAVRLPAFSADGKTIAFTGQEEGESEIYLMAADGEQPRRATFLGADSLVITWSKRGNVTFASNAKQFSFRVLQLFELDPKYGEVTPLPYGPARTISYGPGGGCVLGRNGVDSARWKRYRGGLSGEIWIDTGGEGDFRKLLDLGGNVVCPLWIGKRIFFISDHAGVGNIYSCTTDGEELIQHTHHQDFYVRYPSSDGQRIIYQAGADLHIFDVAENKSRCVPIEYRSPRTQRNRKFINPWQYLDDYDLHPHGHYLLLNIRGRNFSMPNWEGAAVQYGKGDGVRYTSPCWLHDGERFVTVSDDGGEEGLEIYNRDAMKEACKLEGLKFGKCYGISSSPVRNELALTNNRNELWLINLDTQCTKVIERSQFSHIGGFSWSADGKWLAYGCSVSPHTMIIKLYSIETGEIYPVTKPVLRDFHPAFDPDGKYLYFISQREFNPVPDQLHFEANFPCGARPYLITLQKNLPSPFVPVAAPLEPKDKDKSNEEKIKEAAAESQESKPVQAIQIDLDGIEDRIIPFPVPEGRYFKISGLKGKVIFHSWPVEGALETPRVHIGSEPPGKGTLSQYDFEKLECQTFINGVGTFKVSKDLSRIVYRVDNRLRVVKAGEKPDDNLAKEGPSKKSGWIELGRLRASVVPIAEWKQMFREAWRLQREHFWDENMSGIDWQKVYTQYYPLLERVSTRSEFSDLMWEMQGELGTSHAYEMGGDYRTAPHYSMGFLGADLEYDAMSAAYLVSRLHRGDAWNEQCRSALLAPGLNIKEGDYITAVGSVRLDKSQRPEELLVNQAGNEVLLTIKSSEGGQRTVIVKTLNSETPIRYREWVEKNRDRVHRQTAGRIGYVHIPDMGYNGFAEFHRYFLAEVDREGLIVDVRFNGGGFASQLILEKLARKRIGYDVTRWVGEVPYPDNSIAGPLLALTNEMSGSDGDLFSHAFKLMNLGPLIGKRTWGGVIGISFRTKLVDGSHTTQPEHSFWFKDVGWGVENYGTDPTIVVEYRPQDYRNGEDPQLAKGIEVILRMLQETPPPKIDFSKRPQLARK